MKNNGLFCSLFIEELKDRIQLNDAARGRMDALAQKWRVRSTEDTESLWESFLKQALSYLAFVPPFKPAAPGVYPLYEDWEFKNLISVLYLVPPASDIDDTSVGSFYPAKLLAQLKKDKLNWGILTDGAGWRLYSPKSSRPYENYVELPLKRVLEESDEAEYGLFERFFHKDSFVAEAAEGAGSKQQRESVGFYKCRLDSYREQSEQVLKDKVKTPFLAQVDEVLQYICNGFISDTLKSGKEYTEEERAELFESAVKLLYRCLFLFYVEARELLPSDPDKVDLYRRRYSIRSLCEEARKFHWGERRDRGQYGLWKHLKGLINAVNDGAPEYGIPGYDGGLFDDGEERFLGRHRLRNDFMSRALYLLAFVEPFNNKPDEEYAIPYEDLELRHLGELYENILEYTVQLAGADRILRRTRKGVEILLASRENQKADDTPLKKGTVYFGESALERKQTSSYYTPESLVQFLNEKTIVQPLQETFERQYRPRFNALLAQAGNGHDAGTRRGAAQSAAALVERFVSGEVLSFKVCDPAMGSGHFLVDAANQMARLVVALLEEVPHVEGMAASVTSRPNDWRQRITRDCIYGVDLNPLAVNLAKLSLWLNCFDSEHKLTFLDHHVRCGNSLIGIRSLEQIASIPKRKKESGKKKDHQKLLFDYSDLSSVLAEASQGIASITQIDEDDTYTKKAVLEKNLAAISHLHPLADLFTARLMDPDIPVGDYKQIFERLAKGPAVTNTLNSALPKIEKSVQSYRDRHHFYHWPLEFPDVFGPDKMGGFSATVGNPPWNIVKPDPQEFFSNYDPKFRSYKKQEAHQASKRLMADNTSIAEKWKEYCAGLAEQSTYFKEPLSYSALKGRSDTTKLFLEQFFTILNEGGQMGIVVPNGLCTERNYKQLRDRFFNRSRIGFLYCFENRRAIFNIHRSFKFVLLGAEKGGKTDRFKSAFMEHDQDRLQVIDANALEMSIKQVEKYSPNTLSVMEFKRQRDIDVTDHLYGEWPLLGDKLKNTWNVKFRRENFSTNDSHFFKKESTDFPLYDGKMIWLFDNTLDRPRYWLDKDGMEETLGKNSWEGKHYRVGLRSVTKNTQERTLIASLVPPCGTGNTFLTVVPQRTDKDSQGPNDLEGVWLSAILSSVCADYVLRLKHPHLNLELAHMETLPVPRLTEEAIMKSLPVLIAKSMRLICVRIEFSKLWEKLFSMDWQLPDFWYPSSTPIDTYGPDHEQKIRKRLRDEARKLTPEWGSHCGVHDRFSDRRDKGNRAQIRAEIDAYVAHIYGLSRDEFAYILDTFPVLREKEEKAFGEFMSKRKCLEEYDRLASISGGNQ